MRINFRAVLLPLALGAVLAMAWHLAVLASGTRVFPSPALVVQGIGGLYASGKLLPYIADSLLRVAVGYSLAIVLGVPTGLMMGWYDAVGRALDPVLQVLRPISPLAWIPLSIIFFGVSNASVVFLIFLSSFFPITLAAKLGVRDVPEIYLRAGKNFGLSDLELFARVVLPAAFPRMLTGLRISLGIAWLVVVAAEMIAVDSGLGYLILDARNSGKRYDLVIAGMLLIGAIGLALDLVLRRAETLKAVRWSFRKS